MFWKTARSMDAIRCWGLSHSKNVNKSSGKGRLYSKVGLCAAQLYVSASFGPHLVIFGPCVHEGPACYNMGVGMGSMNMGWAGRGYRGMRSSALDLPTLVAIGLELFSLECPFLCCSGRVSS